MMAKAPKMARMPRMKSPARQVAGQTVRLQQRAKAATKAVNRSAAKMRK